MEFLKILTRYKRSIWSAMIVIGATVVVVNGVLLAVVVFPAAVSAERNVFDLGELSPADLLDREGSASRDVLASIGELRGQVTPAVRTTRWMARLSPAIAWLPGLDREVYAWAAQMERLDTDLTLASKLLEASPELLAAFESAETVLVDVRTDAAASTLGDSAADLEAKFSSATMLIDDAERYRLRMPGLRLPRLSLALEKLVEAEDQMRFASEIGLAGSQLLADLLATGESVRPLIGQLVDGVSDGPAASYGDLVGSLEELSRLVDSTRQQSADLAAKIEGEGEGLDLLDKLADLQLVLAALREIGTSASTVLDIMGPVLQSEGTGLFDEGGSMIAAVDAVNSRLSDVSGAVADLELAQRLLGQVSQSGNGEGGLGDVMGMVDSLHDGIELLLEIAPLGRELLGADGPRKYLVLGQSADELRASGGFVSALWLVTIENGAIVDVRYHDTVRVDDWDRLKLYPPAPPGLAVHMNAQVWLLRDVSWEPDFPTVAKTAADMYMIGQRQTVDGVVAINQWTLHSLLGAIGGIAVPGESGDITPNNLFARLEEGSDKFGRAYADLALQGILDNLNKPLSLGSFVKVASAAQTSLRKRDLMIYVEDTDSQKRLRNAGWDGGLGDTGSDYLYVVDSNVGWSKADRNIQRRIRYEVDLSKGPGARATLTLDYINHSGPGSAGCEPQWLNRGTNYSQLKNACYWDFWRVYTPMGSRHLGHTPLELPQYSVSTEIGEGLPGEDTFGVSSSYNRSVMSGLFALGAGEQTQFNMIYDLASEAVSRSAGKIEYELLVQKQPGSRGSEMSLELIVPKGYQLSSSSISPAFTDDSRIGFDFRVDQDTIFTAVLTLNDESR